jgi:hypothetical protein
VDVIAAAAARELERWRGGAYSPGVDGLAVARLGEVQRRVARAAEHSIDVAYAVADEKLEGLLAQVDILIAYVHRWGAAAVPPPPPRRRGPALGPSRIPEAAAPTASENRSQFTALAACKCLQTAARRRVPTCSPSPRWPAPRPLLETRGHAAGDLSVERVSQAGAARLAP